MMDRDITDVDEMIEELRKGRWPVVGLRVTDAFAAAGDAIVLPDGTGRTGHAVLVVGAARVAGQEFAPRVLDGERLLCLRNSWGPAWGRDGHKLISESALKEAFLVAFVLADS
jgi:C1A family cysteine protease